MSKKLLLALGALGFCACASASISVNPMLAFLSGQSKVQDISVTNDGDATAYVQVTPKLMQDVGTPAEKAVVYQSGTTNVSQFGLMVSPLRLAIPAHDSRKVRLVLLSSNNSQDMVYFVNFSPVSSLMAAPASSSSGDTSMQLDSTISYSVQTVALPSNPMPKVSLVRKGTQVTATNTGNSYASLRDGQICDGQGSNCKALPMASSYKVLYAGNTWTFNAPSAGVVKFTMAYAQGKSAPVASN